MTRRAQCRRRCPPPRDDHDEHARTDAAQTHGRGRGLLAEVSHACNERHDAEALPRPSCWPDPAPRRRRCNARRLVDHAATVSHATTTERAAVQRRGGRRRLEHAQSLRRPTGAIPPASATASTPENGGLIACTEMACEHKNFKTNKWCSARSARSAAGRARRRERSRPRTVLRGRGVRRQSLREQEVQQILQQEQEQEKVRAQRQLRGEQVRQNVRRVLRSTGA